MADSFFKAIKKLTDINGSKNRLSCGSDKQKLKFRRNILPPSSYIIKIEFARHISVILITDAKFR
jgi:hypothetical protein